MKKIISILCSLVGLIIINACASTSVLDHGYYSAGAVQGSTAKITVDKNLEITGIDTSSHIAAFGVKGWSKKSRPGQIQEFTINEGVHSISVRFNSGNLFTSFSKVLIAKFEAHKEYKIIYNINKNNVVYDIIDVQTAESVLLDMDSLQGKTKNIISQFINAVLNPTMEGTDKTVVEENDEYILTSLPHMKYELKDKKSNTIQKGFRGFVTDFTFKKGTVYLYETNTISSKEEFLKIDYKADSKIILEVTDCDSKTVTYTYVKPEYMAGKTVTFKISVKD